MESIKIKFKNGHVILPEKSGDYLTARDGELLIMPYSAEWETFGVLDGDTAADIHLYAAPRPDWWVSLKDITDRLYER